jgi:hypothetical protein
VNSELIEESVRAMGHDHDVNFVRRQSPGRSRRSSNRSTSRRRSRSRSTSPSCDRRRRRYTTETRRCYNCHKYGHLVAACRSKVEYKDSKNSEKTASSDNFKRSKAKVRNVDTDDLRIGTLNLSDSDISVNSVTFSSNYVINVVNSFSVTPEALFVQIDGRHIPMDVDTGSYSTICSREDYQRYFAHRKLERVTIPLTTVDGENWMF